MENRLHTEEKITVRDPAKIDLSPCHICHRKPTEKKQLDDFAYCEGCGKRTCFICIRQCEGELGRERGRYSKIEASGTDAEYDQLTFLFHGDDMCFERERREIDETLFTGSSWEKDRRAGHPKKVCSRCCVERGMEGEIWCLGCWRVAALTVPTSLNLQEPSSTKSSCTHHLSRTALDPLHSLLIDRPRETPPISLRA